MAIIVQLLEASAETNSVGIGTHGADKSAVALQQAQAKTVVGKVLPLVAERVDSAMELGSASYVGQIMSGNNIWKLSGDRMNSITIPEGQDVTIWLRLTNAERDLILQADMETILVNVFDTSASDQSIPIFQDDLVVPTVMFSALQLSGGWRQDADGYAFKYELPGDVLGEGGRVYRVEVVFRTKNYGPVVPKALIHTEPLLTPRTELGG